MSARNLPAVSQSPAPSIEPASSSAPRATPRRRSRRRPGGRTRATGGVRDWCAARGLHAIPADAGDRRGVPGRRGRPRVPAGHDRPPRGGDRRRAPRPGPPQPVRLRRRRRRPVRDPPPARHRADAPRGAARPRPARAAARADRAPDTLAGLRDRALLLLGFAAALRRSELVALDVEDLAFDLRRGLLVTIRASKTDQEQAGTQVAVPYARAGNDLCAGPRAPGLAAGRRHPPRSGVPADAPRRQRSPASGSQTSRSR